MIAADTSAWIDYFKGCDKKHVKQLEAALMDGAVQMPLPVLFEILSGAGLTQEAREAILEIPRLENLSGYWERAADLRRGILKKGQRARSMDCLIAQVCLDHDMGLISGDSDYRHLVSSGLKLI
jgi:predicted nucleic acid-binding protein